MQKARLNFINIIAVVMLSVMLLSVAGCSATVPKSDKIKIITTVFPEYDWVKNLTAGRTDQVELTLLLDSGVDLHSYQPTADDIIKISTCDMFVYVGGKSDKWVDDALREPVNRDMTVINLMDVLGSSVKTEEIKEGMEAEEEEEEEEYDEHVWLSVKNAGTLCKYIAARLCELDPDGTDSYNSALADYLSKLDELDSELAAAAKNVRSGTLLFADRFPFRYLTDDYGLDYFAAFAGCSAETEASFKTVSFLASKVDELGLSFVLTIEGTNNSIASAVVDSTAAKNAKILTMNSMQSVTAADVEGGADYIGIMQKNLETLRMLAN